MRENSVIAGASLSEQFQSARTVSRILAVLLGIAFWFMLVLGVLGTGMVFVSTVVSLKWPLATSIGFGSTSVAFESLSFTQKVGVGAVFALRSGPPAVALYLGRRVFAHFAKGEVFASRTVADIRAVSLWMVAVALTTGTEQLLFNLTVGRGAHGLTFSPALLFFGLCTYVAAHVMVEARRIADENASIV